MAGISKYDMPSGSPDGSGYMNAQRGAYALEKLGNFREGAESRLVSSLPGTSRPGGGLSQADPGGMFQSLLSDLKPAGLEQKFPRAGEIKRTLNNIFGVSSEDSIPATAGMTLTLSAREEIRRMKSSLSESSMKARNRSKAFGEVVSKIDKYTHGLSRKRSRADISSGERPDMLLPGGAIPRTGTQSHLTASGLDNGAQKSEERSKSAVPSRRARTAREAGRIDARANGTARPSVAIDRDKDVFKHVNGATTPPEEKGRALSTGVDGWEKSKMKKKRSVIKSDASATASLDRPAEGDREPRQAMQQKLTSHARPRLNNTHGLRSGPVTAAIGVGKQDSISQQSSLETRPFPRNDPGNGSLPIDRRDRPIFSEKDGTALKAANKSNSREDNCASSPTGTAQLNASTRGPRSSSGSLSKALPNIHRSSGNTDDWDLPQSANKLSASVGVMNRKRSTSTSSSPSVGQWVGQRHKIQRVGRRSNLIPVTGLDDISPSDMADSATMIEDGLTFSRRSSSNASQQSKLKGDYAPSPGLSESEQSGAAENKPKDKGKKSSEADERDGSTVQKVATLVQPSRKIKVGTDEDLGDGIRRQGRNGRGSSSSRSGMPASIEKPDSSQWKSGRNSSEKVDSKSGRPPTKKWSERKGSTRPRQSMNNLLNEFTGEPDDDHGELLAAVDTGLACCSPFWKQIEPFLGFLSTEDLAFLNQQIHLTDDTAASNCVSDRNLKIDHGCISLPSTPTLASRDDCHTVSNGIWPDEREIDILLANQANHVEPFLEHLVRKNDAPNRISLCQTLISAIIDEEEVGSFGYVNGEGEHSFDCFEFDEELTPKVSHTNSLGTFQALERVPSNGYRTDGGGGGRYHGELMYQNLGNNDTSSEQNDEGHLFDELFTNQKMPCISMLSEFQYNQMSIDDRILLELNAIGIYPDPVPELEQEQSEEEEVGKSISILEEKLHEVVMKKRGLLTKLEKTAVEARTQQQSELERIALDKLVGTAYQKYMVLGVDKSATQREIQKAFHKLSLQYHPDKNKSNSAKEKFTEINNAYEILSDEEKRKNYELYGDEKGSPNFDASNYGNGNTYTHFTGGPGSDHFTSYPGGFQSAGGQGNTKSFSFSFDGGHGMSGNQFGFDIGDIFSNLFGNGMKGGGQFGGFSGSAGPNAGSSSSGVIVDINSQFYHKQINGQGLTWLLLFYTPSAKGYHVFNSIVEDVANSLSGAVKICAGRVNCQNEQTLCKELGISPSRSARLHVYSQNTRDRGSLVEYGGELDSRSLKQFCLDQLPRFSKRVDLNRFDFSSSTEQHLPQVLLLSSKKETPIMWRALGGLYRHRFVFYDAEVHDGSHPFLRRLGVDALPAVVGRLVDGEVHVLRTGIAVKDLKSGINELSSLLERFEKKSKKAASDQAKRSPPRGSTGVVPYITETNFDSLCGDKTTVCIIGVFRSSKAKGKLEALLSDVSQKTFVRQQSRVQNSGNSVTYALLDAGKYTGFLSAFDVSRYKSLDMIMVAYKPKRRRFAVYWSDDNGRS